jgi:O-antigen ligase
MSNQNQEMSFTNILRYRAINLSLVLICMAFIYCVLLGVYLQSLLNEEFITTYVEKNMLLSAISLVIFILLLCIGLINRNFYFFILPIIILCVPNAINDLFPSFWASPLSDAGSTSLPLITHIDIFLLGSFCILRNSTSLRDSSKVFASNIIFYISLSLFFLSIISILANMVNGSELLTLSILGNNFQIRYLFFMSILLRFVNNFDVNNFFKGYILAFLLLLVESTLFTVASGVNELTSGNFGTNTLGVLCGFTFILVSQFLKNSKGIIKNLFLLLVFLALIFTGTNSAILSLVLSYVFLYIIRIFGIYLSCIFVSILSMVIFAYNYSFISTLFEPLLLFLKTDYQYLINQDMVGGPISSILTRLVLWTSSFGIFIEYPFGIGFSSFNFLKESFGFSVPVFIDPHNDYLNIFVQYGFIGGILVLYTIYLAPFLIQDLKKENLYFISTIFIYIFLTSLSNSNFNKHQFFFLAIFTFFTLFNHSFKNISK